MILNVSDVHLAHRCPRLWAYSASGQREAWKVGLSSSGDFPGTLFHEQIAGPFHQQACGALDGPVFQALANLMAGPARDLEDGAAAVVDRHVLDPFLDREGGRLRSGQIRALILGVQAWGRVMGRFLAQCLGRSSGLGPDDIFQQAEQTFEAEIQLVSGRNIRLRGRVDGLWWDHFQQEPVIVEFKGVRPRRPDEDLIQIALYSLLLRKNSGVTARGKVLYLEEEDIEADYSASDLRDLEENLLGLIEETARIKAGISAGEECEPPGPADRALCSECPFDASCDEDWGSRTKTRTSDSYSDDPGTNPQVLLEQLARVLGGIKLSVEPIGWLVGPRVIRLKIRPLLEKGTTVAKIRKRAEDLQLALACPSVPYIQPGTDGFLAVDLPRPKAEPLHFSRVWELGRAGRPDSPAAFPLGMSVDGQVVWADLTSPTMTSILTAGTSGSGKSVFLKSALIGLAHNSGPKDVRFTLIDPKRVTFGDIQDLPHLDGRLMFEAEEAMAALESLVELMEDRYLTMARHGGIADVKDYNKHFDPWPHHVVVIDEYGDLMTEKEMKKQLEEIIKKLCQKGRAAGIHLILSTQRPDATVVTPLIKANLQLKVALKVTSGANSRIILDEEGAEKLMGEGDMLVGGAVPLIRLQGPLPEPGDVRSVLGV